MAEETTAVAPAPEATPEATPTPEPTPTPEATPTPETPKPSQTNRQAAKSGLGDVVKDFLAGRRGASTEPEPEPTGEQPRKPAGTPEGGQFAKAEAEASEQPAAEQTAETSEQPGEATPEAAPEVAEGYARIELDEGHPLREQGVPYLDVPAAQEQALRATVNSWTRRAQVEAAEAAVTRANQELSELRRDRARLQAETQLMRSGELDKYVDPKLLSALEEAERADPELAKVLREGIEAKKRELIAQHGTVAEQKARDEEAGRQFLHELNTQSATRYGVWVSSGMFHAKVAPIIGQYGDMVDRRMEQGGQGPDVKEFFEILDRVYVQEPEVQTLIKQHREEQEKQLLQKGVQQGRQQREEELKKEREEAAGRHGRRPPTVPSRAQAPTTVSENGREGKPPIPAGQRQRKLRQEARELGREFAQR